jgi:acyl-coenzyme A synthetase/AMP-(fatty) acid ligase
VERLSEGVLVPSRRFEPVTLPYYATIPKALEALVAGHGGNDLIVAMAQDGATVERITYAEADARSAELACLLLARGVVKGSRVGVLAPNGPDFVVAFLAATRIGAVAVPVNTFFQASEVGWLLRHADIHTLLTVESVVGRDTLTLLEESVPGLAGADGAEPLLLASAPSLRNVLALGGSGGRPWLASAGHGVAPEVLAAAQDAVRPADDLVVIYTSGSTCDPKGIIHVHGSVLRHSRFIAENHQWLPDDRVYVPMAFFWVGGLVFGVLGPMQLGVTIITEHRFDAGDVLRLLAAERVTYVTGFPHVGPAIAAHPDFAFTDLSSIRDGYQPDLVPPDRRGTDPTLRVAQLGMTETCSSHTWWPPAEELPEEKRGSLGVTAPGFEHKVIDEQGSTVGPGQHGEICVRGWPMMRGMVGKMWSEVFDREGWYHTGDSAYYDEDGHFYFSGRTDDMIKTSGANVSPVEVEKVLLAMPEVRECYVVGIPDAQRGAAVVGVVVLRPGRSVSPDELVKRARTHLAVFKVPKRWVLLPGTDELPYTTTNKIDKRALGEQLVAGKLLFS